MKKTELVRPSHMLPGLLSSKATNVVICSIFKCKRQVSSRLQPAFAWLPSSQQLPGALLHKAVPGCGGDTQKQGRHLAVRASALSICKGEQSGVLSKWSWDTGQQDTLRSLSPGSTAWPFPLIKGKYGWRDLSNTGQHYRGEIYVVLSSFLSSTGPKLLC